MPEWLRIALIVVAVLVALYLISVAAQIILATLLRRQTESMRVSIQNARQEVARIAEQIEAIAPAIQAGPTEMPFGPLYDQARSLLKHGMTRLRALREQLATLATREIPQQPWADAFKLAPMTTEVVHRWRTRQDIQAALVQLAEINDVLARIEQLWTEIAALPQRQKDALTQLHTRVTDLAARLEGEARPKRPLAEAYSMLREIRAHLAQADELLTDAQPSQSAVMAAHPLLTQADEALQSLSATIKAAAEERAAAEAEFAQLGERFQAFQSAVAVDESAGYARARFVAAASQLAEHLSDIQALIAEGEYTLARDALAKMDKALAAQHDALTALNQERARVASLAEQAAQQLAAVEGWIAETPARFTRDMTGEAADQLRALVERLRALIPMEEIERMAEANELARQVEDAFGRASRANDDFVEARMRFEALIGRLSEEHVTSLTSSAAHLASELSRTNRNYWGNLTPETITAAAKSVTDQWPTIRDRLDVIPESALGEALTWLEGVAVSFDRAATLCAQASQALTRRDADMQQASAALNDDAMTALLAEVGQIAAESPSLAETPARIHARVAALRGDLQTPAPDYRRIYADAEQVRQEAAAFVADYRQQLQRARDQLGNLKRRLEATHDDLNRLREDPRIDFTAQIVEPASAAIREWLSGSEAAVAAPLDAAREALAVGEDVARHALAQFAAATQVAKSVGAKLGSLQAALAELNGLLTSAQIGLREMVEFGSERWEQPTLRPLHERLESARVRLDRLDRPTWRFTPEEAQREMAQLEAAVKELRAQAEAAHADVAWRVAEMRERKAQLAQTLASGDALAVAQPNLAEAWQRIRQQITDLESRWTHAASYAEALEALTQAIQRARLFVEGESALP